MSKENSDESSSLRPLEVSDKDQDSPSQNKSSSLRLLEVSGIKFTKSILTQLGDVKDLLGSFLEEQIATLDDPDSALAILKSFVSVKGTKRQITEEEINEHCKTIGKDIDQTTLQKQIAHFVNIRILRDKDEAGRYELRHDALAAKIYEKITLVEKELMEIRQFIENAYENFQKRGILMSAKDLKYIVPYEDKLILGNEMEAFLTKSRFEADKVKRKKRNSVLVIMSVLLIIFAGFTVWALNERAKATESERQAVESGKRTKALYLNSASKELLETNPTQALRLAQQAQLLDTSDLLIRKNILDIYSNYKLHKIVSSGDDMPVNAVFSPDGTKILVGSLMGFCMLKDLDGNTLCKFKAHESSVTGIAFTPDGKQIVTGSTDFTARIWDIEGNLKKVINHPAPIFNVAYSPDNEHFVTTTMGGGIYLWNRDGQLIRRFDHEIQGSRIAFSPDGSMLATAFIVPGEPIILWDLDGNQLASFSGHKKVVGSLAFSPVEKLIYSADTQDKEILIWDYSGNQVNRLDLGTNILSICFYNNSARFVTGSITGDVLTWDENGRIVNTYKSHGTIVQRIDVSSDNKHILSTANLEQKTCLWKTEGDALFSYSTHNDRVTSIVFSLDGTKVLTGSHDGITRLWSKDGGLLK
ncbi:MAG: hypothetical protein C0594_14720 [Marinilabiliales bacterium]|nr:MAG: hypothetical protein C0594_14720 [Marinilabiliales bacterium]